MKYGMNLLLWSGEVTDAMLPTLETLKKMGYDGVELPVFNLDLDYAKLGKQLDKLGLERTAVTVRNETDNPISPDAAVRAKGVELNKKTLDCCAAAGVQTLVGPYHSALGFFPGHSRTKDEWKWGVDSMRATAEHAGKVGVMLGVEPLNRFEVYFLNGACRCRSILPRSRSSSLPDDVRYVPQQYRREKYSGGHACDQGHAVPYPHQRE